MPLAAQCVETFLHFLAGDDDHKLENNPGRVKALEAAAAVNGVAIFPELSAEQREQGMTDFNDLGRALPEANLDLDQLMTGFAARTTCIEIGWFALILGSALLAQPQRFSAVFERTTTRHLTP
jgi:hypothetical protein